MGVRPWDAISSGRANLEASMSRREERPGFVQRDESSLRRFDPQSERRWSQTHLRPRRPKAQDCRGLRFKQA